MRNCTIVAFFAVFFVETATAVFPVPGDLPTADIVSRLSIRNAGDTAKESVHGTDTFSISVSSDPYSRNAFELVPANSRDVSGREVVLVLGFQDIGAGMTSVEVRVNNEKVRAGRAVSYTRLNTGTSRTSWHLFNIPDSVNDDLVFRIEGLQHLHSAALIKPPEEKKWVELRQRIPRDVEPMLSLERPMLLTTTAGINVQGGYNALEASLASMRELAPIAKVLGFTSIESYVTWKRLEPEKLGTFNFTFYDAIVEVLEEYDLRWFPLLIVGSAYALPEWFLDSDEDVGFTCLEHGIANPIQSIWSPYHKAHVSRVLKAFGDHYEPGGVLEAVRLGPSGNYGESQYPAGGNWGVRGAAMHIHIGWWGDDVKGYGRHDFQTQLKEQYSSIQHLNDAWDTQFKAFDQIELALPDHIFNKRRRLDFTSWYTDSMSEWCRWWALEARNALPNTVLYQSAGGWGFRESGTDYSAQAKAMCEVQGGIRLTNETDSYEQDFYATRLACTAARHYGVALGFEPASSHTARGTVGRIFNTASTNGDHFFTYRPNLLNHPLSIEKWLRYAPILDTRQPPIVEVAVYYPETMNQLQDGGFRHLYAWGFNPRAREIRRVLDVDYLDERLIREGFLDKYKALVFVWGNQIEKDVQKTIDDWMQAGGTVFYPSFPKGSQETIEGDKSVFSAWSREETGLGAFHRFPGDMEPPSLYAEFIEARLKEMDTLHPITRHLLEVVHPKHVFFTAQEDGHALVLNYNQETVVITMPWESRVSLDPYSITRISLRLNGAP